jgi:hypothetical protein
VYTPLAHVATGAPEYPLLQAPAHAWPLKVVPQEKLPLVTVTGPEQAAADTAGMAGQQKTSDYRKQAPTCAMVVHLNESDIRLIDKAHTKTAVHTITSCTIII